MKHLELKIAMKNRLLMIKISSLCPEKDVGYGLFQTLMKNLKTPFRRQTVADDTVWSKFEEFGSPRRLPPTSNFKDARGPIGYAKKIIRADNSIGAFLLIIDNHMMKHIITCIEAEDRRIMKNVWTASLLEMFEFIGILFARGAYVEKN